VDDLANTAEYASSVTERALPLVHYPSVVEFDPFVTNDNADGAEYYQDPASGLNFGYRVAGLGDLDGDSRDDFAVSRINFAGDTPPTAVSVFLSSDGSSSPAVTITAPAVTGALGGFFGWALAGGDFDGDGNSDLAICAQALPTFGGTDSGANGGALYLYYGIDTTGIRRDPNPDDDYLPSVNPDVALFGAVNAQFCGLVAFGELNGQAGQELIVGTGTFGEVDGVLNPRVYAFLGGSRDRFPGSTPVKLHLDLVSPATTGVTNRPELSLQRRDDGNADSYPIAIAAADVDGDGIDELAVSDQGANHATGVCVGCGEVYVYQGGASLVGAIAAPNTSPPQLKHILRHREGPGTDPEQFGHTLARLPQPRTGDTADWLLVQATTAGGNVYVFEGTAAGATPGIVPGTYPAGGLAADQYISLDKTDWHNTPSTSFGYDIVPIGDFDHNGSLDLFVGPQWVFVGDHVSFLYSFDYSDPNRLVKRAVLGGEDGLNAAFGSAAAKLDGYLPGAVSETPQILVASPGKNAVYLLR
jgi:hypothetical protein